MKKILLLVLTVILATLLQNCAGSYKGNTSLVETSKRSAGMPIHNILIVGAGSLASRAFLVNLSIEMKNILNENKIKSTYSYMGEIPRASHLDIDKIANDKYDSYLVLNPIDTSILNLNTRSYEVTIDKARRLSPRFNSLQQRYKEDFSVKLYSKMNNETKKNWEGVLYVDFDFSQKDRFKQMARSIIDKILWR